MNAAKRNLRQFLDDPGAAPSVYSFPVRFFRLVPIFILSAHLSHAQSAPENLRIWTDAQQRKVEAAFDHLEGDQVSLKLKDGRVIPVPLGTLSNADQKWITDHAPPTPDVEAGTPPAAAEWPRSVILKETPAVKTIREDKEKREFIYESEHYEFICDSMLGANLVREFSRVFEATWMLNCLLPLDFRPKPEGDRKKFRARIFTHKSDYEDAGGPENSAGVYISSAEALMVPLDSLGVKMFGSRVTIDYKSEDYATLVHEITHQMMNHWLDRLPIWYIEGSAEYVELAKYDNGRFSFLQQDKRLQERLAGGGTFPMLPLEVLMTISGRQWMQMVIQGAASINYASALALTYYFYHLDGDGDGAHIRAYIKAVEASPEDEVKEDLVRTHLLRGRSYADLQKDVQKSFRRIGITVEFPNLPKK